MDDNRVFEVSYNRAPKEDGMVCDAPTWSRDTRALARYYFENCHGEQWIAAAFSDGDGRVLRVTSSDVDWDTYETELGKRVTVKELVMRLNLIMSPEELTWLSAVLMALDAVDLAQAQHD